MLIRFTIENVFSFGERKEFNMIPYKRLGTLNAHRYNLLDFEILKMASIYGANGAGKSNLINALYYLQQLVLKEEIPMRLKQSQFKFHPKNSLKSQLFAIEFIQDNTAFYYGIELFNGLILTEELYKSGLGKKKDELLFERKTDKKEKSDIIFLEEFEKDEKSQVLKAVLIEEFVKPRESVLRILSNRDNKFIKDIKKAYKWFDDTLQIIRPESRPGALAHRIDKDAEFKKYAENLMCSFNLGISSLTSEKKEIKEFFGEDNENELDTLIKKLEDTPKQMLGLSTQRGDELIIVKEEEKIWVKRLKVGHLGKNNRLVLFDLEEESDGTIRLLDFVPTFQNVISSPKVFVIDEIERSIHPLLIKALVRKFSLDEKTKGQIIFTTHESNLLDQKIFRQDEIWFAEKDKNGSTDLYSLSEFKEHKTIDIRKGYLNGRYGSIPFLANLTDLNWREHVAH
ncbi:MAG TPA: ATP-binding protein [Bacteroidetes bacterium]|nr:ATP-binding protein [Bacteroidota bacterium]